VKIGIDKSRRHLEENGTPQGISPLLFNIMLDVFFFLMFSQELESHYLQTIAYGKEGKM